MQQNTNKHLKIGMLLLSFIILAMFILLRNIQKNKEQISLQNKKIQQSLEEKNILLKEVHHRVKNNLQIIASILDLQNIHINDKKINKILEQGQNRIQSMSLIHQQLYQSKNVSDVNIKKYLNALIKHISIAYNNPNITFNLKTNDLKFNVNTAIPLGLISNELITNIYKHAFDSGQKGKVTIEIKQIEPHRFQLVISDNGNGFPEGFSISKTKSLGLKLVRILSMQLKGKATIKNKNTFMIEFRDDVAV